MTQTILTQPKATDFAFEQGQILRRGTTVFRVVEDRSPLIKLEHSVTLEPRMHARASLELEYARGLIVPATLDDEHQAFTGVISLDAVEKPIDGLPLDMYSQKQQAHLRSVATYIFELRKLGYRCLRPTPLLQMDYERVQRRLRDTNSSLVPLTLRTIYDWSLELDKAGGDVRAVLPLFHKRGGRGNSRLCRIAEEAFATVFGQLRADKDATIRPHDVEYRAEHILIGRVGREQALLIMPSRATIARRVHAEFAAYDIAVRNKGKAAADKEFRTYYPRDRAEWPLEVVEFDDKDSRVFLIDETTGLPYGRAFVTPGVDQYTRVPMGFSISELPRSTWSAICALTTAILPKDPSAPEYSLVTSAIEFAGKPGIALFDNATYNHVKEIDLSAHETGVTPAWAKPFTPTEKADVEGFNGRMDQCFFSTLPGYAGSKKDRAGLAVGTATANMSKELFERLLLKWAYDDYCNAPGVDGYTPRQRWHEKMRLVKPRFPLDIYRLRIAPTLRHSLRFRPEGIRFTGLIYENDRLTKLRRTVGAKAQVEFRYDPRDMSLVYAFDPFARQLFVVESAQPEYTRRLTLYQHRLIRKMARLRGKKNPSIPELLETREELRVLVAQARLSPKKRERFLAKRAGEVVGQDSAGKKVQTKLEKTIMTDLEGQVADIDDVEMETGDEGWEVPEMI
jgi:hypothetical protein